MYFRLNKRACLNEDVMCKLRYSIKVKRGVHVSVFPRALKKQKQNKTGRNKAKQNKTKEKQNKNKTKEKQKQNKTKTNMNKKTSLTLKWSRYF